MKQYLINLSVFVFIMYSVGLAYAITPDIKANGSNKSIQVDSDVNLRITIGMTVENRYPNADWWIVYENGGEWFSYVLEEDWIQGILPCIQYNVFEFDNIAVIDKRLEPGNYNFYFGVDTNPNSILDDPLYFDYISVSVHKFKKSILDYKSGRLTTNIFSDARGCGEGVKRFTRTFEFTREGSQVTFYGKDRDYDPFVLQGHISGNKVKVFGSYNEDGGKTKMNGTITISGNSFEGSLNWTWKNNYFSCSGTDQVSGVMQ